jgi:hypothetical protein
LRNSVITFRFAWIILAFGAACSKAETGSAESAAAATAGAPAPVPAAARLALADFRKLKWLEGSWRGRTEGGGAFYERYRVINDSTIAMGAYDSTFKVKTDSAMIGLRKGAVIDEGGGPRWYATRLDSTMVEFQNPNDAKRRFNWTRESKDRWTARLYLPDSLGKEKITIYPLERVKK